VSVTLQNKLYFGGWIAELPAKEWKVLYAFATHADEATGIAYPTPKYIAPLIGLSERNVKKGIRALLNRGLLVNVSAGGGRTHSARRRVVLPERVSKPTPIQAYPPAGTDRLAA